MFLGYGAADRPDPGGPASPFERSLMCGCFSMAASPGNAALAIRNPKQNGPLRIAYGPLRSKDVRTWSISEPVVLLEDGLAQS